MSAVAVRSGLFRPDEAADGEVATVLAAGGGARVERITSPPGFASPDGFWYEETGPEWVAVVSGGATLAFADGTTIRLKPGDHCVIPARCRHRIAATSPDVATLWLAVHLPAVDRDGNAPPR